MTLPRYAKPPGCANCQLEKTGFGFVPPSGPPASPLLFVGESAGYQESLSGFPFAGAAGSMMERILRRSQLKRELVRVTNCVSCQPPGDWLDGAPWQYAAMAQCRQYLDPVLAEPHQVIVTLGAIPLRQVMDLWGMEGVRVQDFHGTVHQLPSGQWLVPTYHPSHLQRGAVNLLDVVRFDVNRAVSLLRRGGWVPPEVSLLLDPSPTVFALWVSGFLQRLSHDPDGVWLSVDIETPDKSGGRDEGELTAEDASTQIERVNLSYSPNDGVTVPYEGPYIPLIKACLDGAGIVTMWNKWYDEPRLRMAGHSTIGREIWDLMWAAHHLQSDLPLGLGFWTPLYSEGLTYQGKLITAWKHLGKQKGQEALYGGIDGINTTRVGHGIVKDLVEAGMWEAFYRHTHLREQCVLRPAHDLGLLVDVPRLDAFHDKLQVHATEKLRAIGEYQVSGNFYPRAGYTKAPTGAPPKGILGKHKEKGDTAKADYIAEHIKLVEREVEIEIRVCQTCGKRSGVGPKHNCLRAKSRKMEDGSGVPEGTLAPRTPVIVADRIHENRWFWQLPFNPDASQQILRFIRDSGESPGKAKKTKKDTGNKETLRRLSKKTGNPIFKDILDYKAIKKVDSTYAVGAKRRIWADGRLHPTPTFRPSMFRDSYVNPNIQNVVADKDKSQTLAAGFRECIVSSPGCRLVEIDYSGIEGIETGWLSGDPDYIRLAYLGVHAYLASHLLGRPASLTWSDEDLARYFSELKKAEPFVYDKAKRCVHGNNYGLTIHGMVENFPEVYKDLKEAKYVQDLYYAVAPKLAAFHVRMRDKAYEFGRLGGPAVDDYYKLTLSGEYHPYAYRHWFWGVQSFRPMTEADYRKARFLAEKKGQLQASGIPRGVILINQRPFKITMGEDSKRVIAFYPQSIAAGRLKEAEIDLFHPESPDFIGDRYYGRTPFRAPIHDSLLLEVPDRECDSVIEHATDVMRRPEYRQPCPIEWNIGEFLRVGVAVKVGRDWGHMEDVEIPDMQPETVRDTTYLPVEESEYDDVQDLGTQVPGLLM